MASSLGQLFKKYQHALEHSQARHEANFQVLAKNGEAFYKGFFSTQIRHFQPRLKDPNQLQQLQAALRQFGGSDSLPFAAIDGASYHRQFHDYLVFYGGSFGISGTVSIEGSPPQVSYKEWTPDKEDSYSSYLPIPLAEFHRHEDEQFVHYADEEKADFSRFDKHLMHLAEVFLAFEFLGKGSVDKPRLLLLDHSISSLLNSTTLAHDKVPLVGYLTDSGAGLTQQDVVVAYSHPYNKELGVPYPKKPQLFQYVLRVLYDEGPQSLEQIASKAGMALQDVQAKMPASSLVFQRLLGRSPIVEQAGGQLAIHHEYRKSWQRTAGIFVDICHSLFKEKAAAALEYEAGDASNPVRRMLTAADLQFLIGVGIRLVIESAWENQVMLIGIQRQSSSQYLTRNYLGVLDHIGKIAVSSAVTILPSSDAGYLQILPFIDSTLEAPWASIEFDASFMTLRCLEDETGNRDIQGVQGDIVQPQPRMLLRSLAQFYLDREKGEPYLGNVIHIDRLAHPLLDSETQLELNDSNHRLGVIRPHYYASADVPNLGQDLAMLALDRITRNRYPEFIGMPDPLHKAEWGARSIKNKVQPMIASSKAAIGDSGIREMFKRIRKLEKNK